MFGVRYTTWGPVRGDCGHVHRTREAAVKCLLQDQRSCAQQGGYSDRSLRYILGREDLRQYDITKGPGLADWIDEWEAYGD